MNRVFYGILLVVGIGLILMPLSVPVFKSNAPYSVLNTNWNGTSDFGRLLYHAGKVNPVLGPYDSAGIENMKGTLVVIGPDLGFSGGEINALRGFLRNGGVLLLADDFGTGNELLKGLGLGVRLSRKPLLSLTYSKNADFPITRQISPEFSAGVDYVILDRPAVILGVNSSDRVILSSSSASFFEGIYGSFPLAVEIPYGKGEVVLLSDPDLFTNALFTENKPFLRDLIGSFPKTFYIDEAHHANFNPYSVGTITIRRAVNRKLAFYYVLFVAVLAFFVESGLASRLLGSFFSLLLKLFPEEGEDLDEIVKRLEERGLDGDKLKRLIKEIETGSRLGGVHGR
ncbi:DUF4350 domain-containing protein [Thermococcus sp.]|uniref:DUF4350 domain-containing protein n=1 Tax=Thermococcus sp. TaxID=35749 RepID=UPI00262285EA|nr:DUF4350 domain-containing protein [Thermococcus sp.]